MPLDTSEGAIILHFQDLDLPIPWQAKVRAGGNRESMYAILTFDDVESAMIVLRRRNLRWPDPNLALEDRKHMLIRLDIYKHGC